MNYPSRRLSSRNSVLVALIPKDSSLLSYTGSNVNYSYSYEFFLGIVTEQVNSKANFIYLPFKNITI